MQHSELPESTTYARVSLYAAGLGAASTGVLVMGRAVGDAAFTLLAMVSLLLGFAASLAVRLGRLRRAFAEAALLLLLTAGTVLIFADPSFRYIVLPIQTLTSPDLVLAAMLVWLMIVYSFNLRSDRAVLFICVPPLSLIGLMSTFDPSGQPLVYFIMYLCFGCFILVQQNALSHAAPDEQRRVKGNLKLAVGITVQALIVGAVLGWALQTTLERAAGPSLIARNARTTQEPFADSDFMEVATGPSVLGEREVMMVMCREGLLWRSQVYDRYTGRGWMSTLRPGDQPELSYSPGGGRTGTGSPRFPSYPSSFTVPLDPESRARAKVRRVDQMFRITGGRISSVYAAAEPEVVAFRGPQMLLSSNGRVSLRLPYGVGGVYAVSSLVSSATPRDLRQASTLYPADIEEMYLQVPDSCMQLQAAVDELVKALPTSYDKVMAVQNYLESNYTYDLTAPAAPFDEDAVVHFLLKSRRGYCDIFASSMAVMCRMAGVPCRVAVGYAQGKREDDRPIYHVLQKDKHAWVEAFFPGHGWVSFDPAPQERGLSIADRVRGAWKQIVAGIGSRGNSFWLFAALFALVGYLMKVELLDRLLRRRGARASASAVGRAGENFRRMCDAFARLGHPRHPSTTPIEYLRGIEAVLRPNCSDLLPAAEAVTSDFVEARYAGRTLTRQRVADTSALLRDLLRGARQASRRKMLNDRGETIAC
ncbi:MAG: transglutaminase domain-containing protein [Armatimonadetes bacterium]|nr:transglutaminase domain-containing protein [Armatimonadota bacterium]